MTAFAPTWTGRVKITYFAAQAVHTQTWRYPGPASGSGVTDLLTTISSFYNALANVLYEDFNVNSVTVADIDSPVFLPIINPFASGIGTVALIDFEPEEKANVATFVGRSTGGHPWKIGMFGLVFGSIEVAGSRNYRVLETENITIGSAISALIAGAGTILANDANTVAMYNYCNLKPNDRWVKKVRRGT